MLVRSTATADLEAVAPVLMDVAVSARAGGPTATVSLEATPAGAPIDVALDARAGDPTAALVLEVLNLPTIDTIPAHANEVVRALITLDDFTDGDALQENWFRISQSLGSVSSDSDMLVAANLTLDRMRWRSSDNRITFNRTGTGSISGYFGDGNPGHTQFIFIAVADGDEFIAEIDIDAEVAVAGTSTLRLDTITTSAAALLDRVEPGGVINLVIGDDALAPASVSVSARAGDPTTTLNLEVVAAPLPLDVAIVSRAGDPTAALNLEAVTAAAPLDIAITASVPVILLPRSILRL